MAECPLHVVWVEPRFPGRLGVVADWLTSKRGYRSTFYCQRADPPEFWPNSVGHGLELRGYVVGGAALETAVTWQRTLERGLCHAFAFYEALERDRIRPIDVIIGRSHGLGSALFAQAHAPRTPVVQWMDAYIPTRQNDLDAGLHSNPPDAQNRWRRSTGAMDLLDLENAQVGICGSNWERESFPAEYRDSLTVIPEGVDLRRFQIVPRTNSALKVITFAARTLDRVRGFDRFVTIVDQLMNVRHDIHVKVLGDEVVDRPLDIQWHGRNHARKLLANLNDSIPMQLRGFVTQTDLADVLCQSTLHLDPSRVHSVPQTTLEAMAAGAVVLASDTPAHREVITSGVNGFLINAEDTDAWVRVATELLEDPSHCRTIGLAARESIRVSFDRDQTLSRLAKLLEGLIRHHPDVIA